MGLFDRFKRNRKKTVLPTEVDEYYKSEMRTRRGTSILFALFALVVTLAIAAGLFFGGRAIYRALSNDDNTQAPVQTDNNKKVESTNQDQSSSSQSSDTSNSSQSQNSGSGDTPVSSDGSGSNNGSNSSNGADSDAPSNMPSTGDEPEVLPSTGDN